jgi:hypothetical protein
MIKAYNALRAPCVQMQWYGWSYRLYSIIFSAFIEPCRRPYILPPFYLVLRSGFSQSQTLQI